MGSRRQNTTERRLAQVRAIKDRYFAEELTVEERLEAKDARIALLEGQVAELKQRLERIERVQQRPQAPRAERRAAPMRVVVEDDDDPRQAGFDFYRD